MSVESERRSRPVPYEDLVKIWGDTAHGMRDRVFWVMAHETAARADELLGINIEMLFSLVFALGAMLAGLAGMLIAPITEASIGMGNNIIITAFVVIIVGGIGSMKGAFIAALLIGLIDTLGRSYLDDIFKLAMSSEAAETSAPAISAMLIYIIMAVVLAVQLVAEPTVLLLDEPTRGLDEHAKAALAAVLAGLAETGTAVVVATHDVEFVAEVADRVVVMAEGEVVTDGNAAEVLAASPAFAPQVARILAPAKWLTVAQVRKMLDEVAS